MSAITTLPVTEIFGPTFQGEGPSAGRLAGFVRLGGCNLTCDRCDTPYTWDASRFNLRKEMSPMSPRDILLKLPAAPLTVITGGEPLMYQSRQAMVQLVGSLTFELQRAVEIETNGTLEPADWLARSGVRFNVSPKLRGPMSHDAAHKRIVPAALKAWARLAHQGKAIFKFVVVEPADVHAAAQLAEEYEVPRRAVWVMPEGTSPHQTIRRAQALADVALTRGLNLTMRQHVLLWPDDPRGR